MTRRPVPAPRAPVGRDSKKAIVSDTKARIDELKEQARDLAVQITDIDNKERREGRISSADAERRAEMRSLQQSVLNAIRNLSLVRMAELDQSDKVKSIKNAVSAAVRDLQHAVDRIERIKQIANRISAILSGVAEIADRIDAVANQSEG